MVRSLVGGAAAGHKEEFLAMLRLSCTSLLNEKALKEGDYLVVSCTLVDNENEISSHAMIDNSATAYAFIDEDYARCKNLPLYKLKEPRRLEVFNETLTTSGNVTHVTKVQIKIGQYTKALFLFVTKLEHYSVILEHL